MLILFDFHFKTISDSSNGETEGAKRDDEDKPESLTIIRDEVEVGQHEQSSLAVSQNPNFEVEVFGDPLALDSHSKSSGPTNSSSESRPTINSEGKVKELSSNHIIKDIGLYVNNQPDDYTKYLLLEEHWKPPSNYVYPYSENSKGVKRYLSKTHLENHTWLVLSESKKGLFCKYCALFAQEKAGHNKGVKLGRLVIEPLTRFKDLTGKDGDLQTHERSLYHKTCVEMGKDFLKTYKSPNKEVINQVCSERLRQVTENRERLKPIIKTIILLGRQNIPFRGHRDDGPINLDIETSAANQGNFKALLQFRVDAGDKALEKHLNTSSSRATYISKTTQNALIECCGDEIRDEILKRILESKYWSMMFDETSDLSHKEQITLVVRYLWKDAVREDFITFIDAYNAAADVNGKECKENKLSGKTLGEIVLRNVKELGLDLSYCVGIGTDGASVMTSKESGSVTKIQSEAVSAKRLPCYNHALNNYISKSNKIRSINNAVGIMKEVIHFYNQSAKRNAVLTEHVGRQLVSLCETRWVDRHDAVILFFCALPEIVDSFTEISEWKESESAKKAVLYINSITSTEFIFSCVCLVDILKRTLPLSKLLQKPNLDLNKASNAVTDTLTCLKDRRRNCDDHFTELYLEALTTSEKLGVQLKMPRVVKSQRHRENYEAETVMEYYRMSMYIPLLDNVITDLQTRFSEENLLCFDLNLLMPANMLNTNVSEKCLELNVRLQKVCQNFKTLLPSDSEVVLEGELSIWRAKWSREKEEGMKIPNCAIEVLKCCDGDMFPTVRTLLQILITLPVSVASAERSFSSLKLVKSWLRTRMVEERLNGLCLLYIHRDIEVNVENVIERYAKGGKRRLDFIV
ncbi:52 kDa repressor of the inhibitor of the protein kinase-like [Diabrotica virgifera virgifera]|uniref:52 kDa repressor of the inhibitor of the protein kinase-like n=1 Tax=Diabrotica virgifera virgifera TaxID=50390 RepID=A0ABM5K582_DIAVI|nr:52 kDa repressor of the inhibitor of the protein kinase-like [Diabrotica virgifera virgifera]